jgi:hypothetical protein
MKKILSILGIIAIVIVASLCGQIGKLIGDATFSPSKATPQEVEARLIEVFTKTANQLNPKLPMMIDQVTRLDRISIGPGPRAVYHYTFPQQSSRDFDARQLQTALWTEVVRNVCANADMKKSLQYGGIYVYVYCGSDGIEITRFEIDRKDCGYSLITP